MRGCLRMMEDLEVENNVTAKKEISKHDEQQKTIAELRDKLNRLQEGHDAFKTLFSKQDGNNQFLKRFKR